MLPRPAALALVLLVAACGGSDSGSGDEPPPPSGPSAVLQPASGTTVARLVSAVVTGAPAGVTAVQLRGGGFVQADPTPLPGPSAAGALTADVAYGEVLCDGRAAPVAVLLTTPSGVVEAPVADDALLAGLRAAECAR